MIAHIADLPDCIAPLKPMPRIDTSSDMYQNRDRSLTTFKKDLDPSVAYRDLPKADEKQRVREIQQDVTTLKNQDIVRDEQRRKMNKADQPKLSQPERNEPPNPPLYEPRKAPPDRPVDASSFVTGGTVDVRA